MNDNHLDPVHDLMIRALCNELSEKEAKELAALLERDAELRAEWDELRATQHLLRRETTDADVSAAPFVLPAVRAPRVHRRSLWRSRSAAAAAGFAAAAALFAGLLLAGLRVDRSDGGLLLRWGGPRPSERLAQLPTPGPNNYVSRAELAATAQMIVEATQARLDELDRRQSGLQTELARSLYGALSERQEIQYADLRQRIEITTALQRAGYRARGEQPSIPQSWKEPRKD